MENTGPSILPFVILIGFLPSWVVKTPVPQKHHPQDLPSEALELIPGIGPKLSKQLQTHKNWSTQKGIGPKTKHKLSQILEP